MNSNEMIGKVWSEVKSGGAQFLTDQGVCEVNDIRVMYGKSLSCTLSNGKLLTLNEENIWHLFPKFCFRDR